MRNESFFSAPQLKRDPLGVQRASPFTHDLFDALLGVEGNMPDAAASGREVTTIARTAIAAGAVAFLAPHLFFLFARGQATLFNPPTSLWPTNLLLAVAAAAVTVRTRASWLRAAAWCETGAIVGVVVYLILRGARGEDLNLWPIALVLGAVWSAVPIACGSAGGALLARLLR